MTAYKMRVHLSDPDSTLNVRDAPSKTARRIGRIGDGATVTVQAELDSGWRFVSYGDSGSGYVDGQYLEAVEDEPEQDGDAVRHTTLISDDTGAAIMLVGRWHAADD